MTEGAHVPRLATAAPSRGEEGSIPSGPAIDAIRKLRYAQERILREAWADGYRGLIGFADWALSDPRAHASEIAVTIGFDTIRATEAIAPDRRTWTFFDLGAADEVAVNEALAAAGPLPETP